MNLSQSMNLWERIEAVLFAKAPPIAKSLLPGATLEELEETERTIGSKFPDFLRAAYLRHNGQAYRGEGCHEFLMPAATWTPLAECRENWRMLSGLEAELLAMRTNDDIAASLSVEDCAIRKVPWHVGHIPIGACPWDEYFFLDLAPGGLGKYGQLFARGMEDDYYQTKTCGESLEQYMTTLVDHLEHGSLVYDLARGRLKNPLNGELIVSLLPTMYP